MPTLNKNQVTSLLEENLPMVVAVMGITNPGHPDQGKEAFSWWEATNDPHGVCIVVADPIYWESTQSVHYTTWCELGRLLAGR